MALLMVVVAIREMAPGRHVVSPGETPLCGLDRAPPRSSMVDFDTVDRDAVWRAATVDEVAKEGDAVRNGRKMPADAAHETLPRMDVPLYAST
jgi:hypothetical protein